MGDAMKRAGLLLVILLVATAQTTDFGQTRPGRTGTGGELVQDCTLYFEFLGRTGAGRDDTFDEDPFGMGYCAGLVRGVATVADSHLQNQVCLTNNATGPQAVWAVVQYLNNNPLTLSDPDAELVLRAMQSAFPCR
ncbi:MAG: hypothetical protein CL477_15440 [Acidobacteria bacterium]|jgi:hypothetical protein|nr:hypothetical protein [Acidobacteriota bacterium]